MARLLQTALLTCGWVCAVGCASLSEGWSVRGAECVSIDDITFSGLGGDVAISPSGRYVAAGNSLVDLQEPDEPDRRINKLSSYERSVFASDDTLITTRGPTFFRYPLEPGWEARERFTLGDGGGIAALMGSVGPYDVQRRDDAALLIGFSAPSDTHDDYRLVGGAFGGDRALVQSDISFAQGHNVYASDAFVIVEADVFPAEMERVRRDHSVIAARPSTVCVAGFVTCYRKAPAVRALIALDRNLNSLDAPTRAMSSLRLMGFLGVLSVNGRGDILVLSRRSAKDREAIIIAADGKTKSIVSFQGSAPHGALSDFDSAALLFAAGHSGEKRLIVAEMQDACAA